jgi:hypothetical protein
VREPVSADDFSFCIFLFTLFPDLFAFFFAGILAFGWMRYQR